jgi:hypothetical protein
LASRSDARGGHVAAVASDGPLIVRSARARLRSALGSKALFLWQLAWEDQAGRTLESRLVAVLVDGLPRYSRLADMKRAVRDVAEHLAHSIESIGKEWLDNAASAIRALAETRLARERAILVCSDAAPVDQFQPGLFDRRAERDRRLARDQADALQHQLADRITTIERAATVVRRPPALLFVVLP